ncbi:hypothetical protein ACV35H_33285, partial [Pseudomonas aeruginosa]
SLATLGLGLENRLGDRIGLLSRAQLRHPQADGLSLAAGEQADAVADEVLQAAAEGHQAVAETGAARCLPRPARPATVYPTASY